MIRESTPSANREQAASFALFLFFLSLSLWLWLICMLVTPSMFPSCGTCIDDFDNRLAKYGWMPWANASK